MDDSSSALRPAERSRTSAVWLIVRFLLHLSVVYFIAKYAVPWLSGWTQETVQPALDLPTSRSRFEFLFSHVFILSFALAFAAGLVNARFRHKAAWFVWLVPSAILAYKLITFPSASVLSVQSHPVLYYYFAGGFHIPQFSNWQDFWTLMQKNPEMARGMAQLSYSAPFYAGVGYSTAAWIGQRLSFAEKISGAYSKMEESWFTHPVESDESPVDPLA
jgi:hypothetical protein